MQTPWRRQAKRFEQTALPHLAEVYRLARQMSNETTAQDLAQETYLRAWKYFDSFEQGTNVRSWLFRILHNVLNDRWRQARLEIPMTEKEEATVQPYYDWEDEFLKGELSEGVERALSELPDIQRWAVLLADVEELAYQEIAQIMNCPIGTVMSRINRGRRALARLLRSETTPRIEDVGSGYNSLERR